MMDTAIAQHLKQENSVSYKGNFDAHRRGRDLPLNVCRFARDAKFSRDETNRALVTTHEAKPYPISAILSLLCRIQNKRESRCCLTLGGFFHSSNPTFRSKSSCLQSSGRLKVASFDLFCEKDLSVSI